MSKEVQADLELDLKGLLCPMPVVKIAQAIKEVEVGAVIHAVATDPGVMADIPAWTQSTGHELVNMQPGAGVIDFWVRRTQ